MAAYEKCAEFYEKRSKELLLRPDLAPEALKFLLEYKSINGLYVYDIKPNFDGFIVYYSNGARCCHGKQNAYIMPYRVVVSTGVRDIIDPRHIERYFRNCEHKGCVYAIEKLVDAEHFDRSKAAQIATLTHDDIERLIGERRQAEDKVFILERKNTELERRLEEIKMIL